MDDSTPCVFCERIATTRPLAENELAVAFPDAFPLSPGHTLVVPRRHESDFFALSEEEQAAIWRLVGVVRSQLARERRPDGFNVGLNAGAAAGQTVAHAHFHVIPRYAGDSKDPRGGIRWLMPDKVRYWEDK